jgi:GntR family transcriptional regulator
VTTAKTTEPIGRSGTGLRFPNSLESFSATAKRMRLESSSVVLRAEVLPATIDEAERLTIAPGTRLFHLDRIRQLGGVPVAIDRSNVPDVYAPDLGDADFRAASLYEQLALAGLEIARADTTIESRGADAEVADLLGIAVGKPTLLMHQTVLDAHGRALFSSRIQYAGDRYRLRTFFARSNPSERATHGHE